MAQFSDSEQPAHRPAVAAIAASVVRSVRQRGLSSGAAHALGEAFQRIVARTNRSLSDTLSLAKRIERATWRSLTYLEDSELWEGLIVRLAPEAASAQPQLPLQARNAGPREYCDDRIISYCSNCSRPLWESDGCSCLGCGTVLIPSSKLEARKPIVVDAIVSTCWKCGSPILESGGPTCSRCGSAWWTPSQ